MAVNKATYFMLPSLCSLLSPRSIQKRSPGQLRATIDEWTSLSYRLLEKRLSETEKRLAEALAELTASAKRMRSAEEVHTLGGGEEDGFA